VLDGREVDNFEHVRRAAAPMLEAGIEFVAPLRQ
jgi:hypothetical protein